MFYLAYLYKHILLSKYLSCVVFWRTFEKILKLRFRDINKKQNNAKHKFNQENQLSINK